MARAKHRDRLRQREFESLVKSVARGEKHKEMLAAHRQHKKDKRQ